MLAINTELFFKMHLSHQKKKKKKSDLSKDLLVKQSSTVVFLIHTQFIINHNYGHIYHYFVLLNYIKVIHFFNQQLPSAGCFQLSLLLSYMNRSYHI